MNVLCDLDGVVYRGSRVIPGSAEALARLASEDVSVFYITNNSTRTPAQSAEKIRGLTGLMVDPDQVITSSLASIGLLGPDSGPVLVVGEDGVRDAVARAGLATTDDPLETGAVVVGLTRAITYDLLAMATTAIRSGARFIATNDDPTFPTETGIAPGAGAIVAALSAASGRTPEVAGKPHRPMRDAIRAKGIGRAWVIGDRHDTDIALAHAESDWRSILVLTGVASREDGELSGADFVVDDLAAAVGLVLTSAPTS